MGVSTVIVRSNSCDAKERYAAGLSSNSGDEVANESRYRLKAGYSRRITPHFATSAYDSGPLRLFHFLTAIISLFTGIYAIVRGLDNILGSHR